MPEQKCLTVDGTQVLWKHYRKKHGTEDVIKFCFGKALPEKQWETHHLPHAVVNACSTNSALVAAVRNLAAEVMGATLTLKPPKDAGCCDCRNDDAKPPTGGRVAESSPVDPTAASNADFTEPDAVAPAAEDRFAALPSELFQAIFSHMALVATVLHAGLVCREWRAAAELRFRSLCTHVSHSALPPRLALGGLRRLVHTILDEHTVELDLRSVHCLADADLDWADLLQPPSPHAPPPSPHAPPISPGAPPPSPDAPSDVPRVPPDSLRTPSDSPRTPDSPHAPPDSPHAPAVAPLRLRGLRSIDLSATSANDRALTALSRHRQLRSLRLWAADGVTDAGVLLLASCTALEHLDLRACGPGVTGRGSLEQLTSSLPQLRALRLRGVGEVGDAVLINLGRCCPHLSHLQLSCPAVTDGGVARLAS